MELLELAKKNLDKYIYIVDFINFISKVQQTPVKYVALFLLSQGLHRNVQTYSASKYYIVESIDDWNWGEFCETNNLLIDITNINDEFDSIYEIPQDLIDGKLGNLYWKISDLIDLEVFKSLNINWYLLINDIRNITYNSDFDQIHDYQSILYFEEHTIKNLLISHLDYGPADQQAIKVNTFVESLFRYFQKDLNDFDQIFHTKIKEFFLKYKIIIKGFNDNLDMDESSNIESSPDRMLLNIYDENYLKIIEEELSYVPKIEIEIIDGSFNFNPSSATKHENKGFINIQSNTKTSYDYKFYLFKKPLLTFHEAACIITGYDPQYVEQCQNDTNFKQNFSNYLGAKDYIDTCTDAQILSYNSMDNRIDSESFKHFLANDGTFIDGFNDHLRNIKTDENYNNQHSIIDQLKEENEKLNNEILILKEQLNGLENPKLQSQQDENAMDYSEINILNSDLLLISALLYTLQNEIKVRGNKSQSKILQKIEDEHVGIKGLSKSRTEKIIAEANKIYKPLIKQRMK